MTHHPAIISQDNVKPHMAYIFLDCFPIFATLPWPARLPDLSPIKHEWDMVDRHSKVLQIRSNNSRMPDKMRLVIFTSYLNVHKHIAPSEGDSPITDMNIHYAIINH